MDEEPSGEPRQTMLEHLEARSPQAVAALSPQQLVFELDLLFDQVIDTQSRPTSTTSRRARPSKRRR